MEGLPVRQWRKQPAAISTVPLKDAAAATNAPNSRWTELPMPRGSELYPPWCQALLRAARRGQVKNPASRPAEEEKDGALDDEEVDADGEGGFVSSRWAQVPRDLEQPEPEFLAKRRKGLQSLYGVAAGPAGAVMRKTKVKKVDAEGNISIYEVLAPEGAMVEGEILEGEEVMAEAAVPGTVVEGVGIVNAEGVVVASDQVLQTPQRRRPPPPKRKPKGPGRGRKKKVVIESAGHMTGVPVESTETAAGNVAADGNTLSVPGTLANGGPDAAKVKEESVTRDGDEGSDEDDDEGEEGDDADREEGEITEPGAPDASPSKQLPPPVVEAPPTSAPAVPTVEEPINRDASSSPEVPLAAAQALPSGIKSKSSDSESSLSPANEAPLEPAPSSIPPTLPVKTEADMDIKMSDDNTIPPQDHAAEAQPGAEPAIIAPTVSDAVPAPMPAWSSPVEAPRPSEAVASPQPPPTAADEGATSGTGALSIAELTKPPRDTDIPSPRALEPSITTAMPAQEIVASTDLSSTNDALKQVAAPPEGLAEPTEPPIVKDPLPVAEPVTVEMPLTIDEPVTVEEPPTAGANTYETKAEIPADHNPLDGLAAPQEPRGEEAELAAKAEAGKKEESGTFPDGEEDLFGSLEAHLNKGSDAK